jgi:hypothetical protein
MKTVDEVIKKIEDHIKHEEKERQILWTAVFGDKETQTVGMKEKVDEIHSILTQVKGIKSFLGILILISGALVAIKMWVIKP